MPERVITTSMRGRPSSASGTSSGLGAHQRQGLSDRAAVGLDVVAAPENQRHGARQGRVGGQQPVGLGLAIGQREGGGHPEGVEGVDVAARGEDLRRADQVAAGDGGDEAATEGAEEGGDFGVVLEVLRGSGAGLGVVGHQRQVLGALGVGHRAAKDVEAVGDEGAFGFQEFQPEGVGVGRVHIHGLRLFGDQKAKIFAVGRVGGKGAEAG
jgi:hypothetical protein